MHEIDGPHMVRPIGTHTDDGAIFMIKPTFAFMALRQLQPFLRQIRSTFLWFTFQPEIRSNCAILRYPYRPYIFASLIMSCLSASASRSLLWYVIVERATPKTLHVRRSDVFSFWRTWITVWRFNSALRPRALGNQGFLWGSASPVQALPKSFWATGSLFPMLWIQITSNAPCRCNAYAIHNRSCQKYPMCGRHLQHPYLREDGLQSHAVIWNCLLHLSLSYNSNSHSQLREFYQIRSSNLWGKVNMTLSKAR